MLSLDGVDDGGTEIKVGKQRGAKSIRRGRVRYARSYLDVSRLYPNGGWGTDNARCRPLLSDNQPEVFKNGEIVPTPATAAKIIAMKIFRGLIVVHIKPATPHGDFALETFLEGVEFLVILQGGLVSYGRRTSTGENAPNTKQGGKDPSPSTQCSISSKFRRNHPWRDLAVRRTSFFVSCTYGTQAGCDRYAREAFAASWPLGLPGIANGGRFGGPCEGIDERCS